MRDSAIRTIGTRSSRCSTRRWHSHGPKRNERPRSTLARVVVVYRCVYADVPSRWQVTCHDERNVRFETYEWPDRETATGSSGSSPVRLVMVQAAPNLERGIQPTRDSAALLAAA